MITLAPRSVRVPRPRRRRLTPRERIVRACRGPLSSIRERVLRSPAFDPADGIPLYCDPDNAADDCCSDDTNPDGTARCGGCCIGIPPAHVDLEFHFTADPIKTDHFGFYWRFNGSSINRKFRLTVDANGCFFSLTLPRGAVSWTQLDANSPSLPPLGTYDGDLSLNFSWYTFYDGAGRLQNRFLYDVGASSQVYLSDGSTLQLQSIVFARWPFYFPVPASVPTTADMIDGHPQCLASHTNRILGITQATGLSTNVDVGSVTITPIAPDPPPAHPCPKGCPEPGDDDSPGRTVGYYVIEFGGDPCVNGRKIVVPAAGDNLYRTAACSFSVQITCSDGGFAGADGTDGKWIIFGGFAGCGPGLFRFASADIPQDKRFFPPPLGGYTLIENTMSFTPTIVSMMFVRSIDDLAVPCPSSCSGCGCFAATLNFFDVDPLDPTNPNTNQALYGNRTYPMARSGCEWFYDVTDGSGVRRKVRLYCSAGQWLGDFLGQRSGHPDVTRTFKWPAEPCPCPSIGAYPQTPAVASSDPAYTTFVVAAASCPCPTDCTICCPTLLVDIEGSDANDGLDTIEGGGVSCFWFGDGRGPDADASMELICSGNTRTLTYTRGGGHFIWTQTVNADCPENDPTPFTLTANTIDATHPTVSVSCFTGEATMTDFFYWWD
jgi:hypothetical protein